MKFLSEKLDCALLSVKNGTLYHVKIMQKSTLKKYCGRGKRHLTNRESKILCHYPTENLSRYIHCF